MSFPLLKWQMTGLLGPRTKAIAKTLQAARDLGREAYSNSNKFPLNSADFYGPYGPQYRTLGPGV